MESKYQFNFKNLQEKKRTKSNNYNNFNFKRLKNHTISNKQKVNDNPETDAVSSVQAVNSFTFNESMNRAADIFIDRRKSFNNHKSAKTKISLNNQTEQGNRKIYSRKHKKVNHYFKFYRMKENLTKTLNAIFKIIKTSYFSVTGLIYYGIGALLLIVITLYIGIFSSLSNDSVYGLPISHLSTEVIAYTDVITSYANQYGIEEYVPLIQAIMMHETKGLTNDPMNILDFLDDKNVEIRPNQSIELGVEYLSECLNKAEVNSVTDKEKIYLAIQGYDYKLEYITWAKENFDGYSKSNAQVYHDFKREDDVTFNGDVNYVNHVLQYLGLSFGTFNLEPNFDNHLAWGNNNPYSAAKLYGQCTWFAWGRFYELYGFSPGFLGNGDMCAYQLVEAHPDLFELSSNPQIGAIYSCIGRNHVGIVVGWDGENITIQEGNLDSKTNTFADAKKDWRTKTYNIDDFRVVCKGVIFAVHK